MDNVLVCPASGPLAAKHLRDTIESGKQLDSILSHIPLDFQHMFDQTYKERLAWVWGMRAGIKNRWEQLDTDDVVVFYQQGIFRLECAVTYKLHSVELSDFLWQRSPSNEPFEYIFFVTRPHPINLSIQDFNELISVSPAARVLGTNLYTGLKADRILNRLATLSGIAVESE